MNKLTTTFRSLEPGGLMGNLRLRQSLSLLTFLLFAFLPFLMEAQTNWTGASGTDWGNASNWDAGVPTTTVDAIIPSAPSNQPVIGSSTNAEALSVNVLTGATLDIMANGSLSIDGSTGFFGIQNLGTITNNGSINIGLISSSTATAIVSSGTFINEGAISTGQYGTAGKAVINSTGSFTNDNTIDVADSPAVFGVAAFGGLFTNNGNITTANSNNPLRVQGSSTELVNNGVITTLGAGIAVFSSSTLTNNTCAEIYGISLTDDAGSTIENAGLISLVNPAGYFGGTWNNTGTLHSESTSILAGGNAPINNDDLIIVATTLTEVCGEFSPAFEVGPNLGSTVSIYTNAGATISAGAYDSGTNTFTPSPPLATGIHNLFVKVEDDANVCDDYFLTWDLTVVTAPCDNDGDGFTVNDGDCDDTNALIFPGATNVPAGIVTLLNQTDVDNFVNGCSCVNSIIVDDLNINAQFQPPSNITDISGLSKIIEVTGDLDVNNNPSLTTIAGLENITSVGGLARVVSNAGLQNIDGLSGLTTVGGDLRVQFNINIQNVDGLSNLTSVTGNFQIGRTSVLANLDALTNLTSVGALGLFRNDALVNIDGLSNLTTTGGLVSYFRQPRIGKHRRSFQYNDGDFPYY